MLAADQVLITHEHLDHVMAVARHPDPAALARAATLASGRAMKARQFDDPKGDASRILTKEWDDRPKP